MPLVRDKNGKLVYKRLTTSSYPQTKTSETQSNIENYTKKLEDFGYKIEAPKEKKSFLGRIADVLRRGETAPAVLAALKGQSPVKSYLDSTFGKYQKPTEIISYTDVLDYIGWKPKTKIGQYVRGGIGLGLDILLDPKTYITFGAGAATKIGKGASTVALTKSGKGLYKKVLQESIEKAGKKGLTLAARQNVDTVVRQMIAKNPAKYIAKGGIKVFGKSIPGTSKAFNAIGDVIGKNITKVPGFELIERGFHPTKSISRALGQQGDEYVDALTALHKGTRFEIDESIVKLANKAKPFYKKYGKDFGKKVTGAIESGIPGKFVDGPGRLLDDIAQSSVDLGKVYGKNLNEMIYDTGSKIIKLDVSNHIVDDIANKFDLIHKIDKKVINEFKETFTNKSYATLKEIQDDALEFLSTKGLPGDEFGDFVNFIVKGTKEIAEEEKAAGLLQTQIDNYVRRYITPEARKEVLAKGDIMNMIPKPLRANLDAAKQRQFFPEKSIKEINEWAQKELGYKFFEEDAVKAFAGRVAESKKALKINSFLYDIGDKFGIRKGVKGLPDEFWENGIVYAKSTAKQLNDVYLPKEIVRNIDQFKKVITNDETSNAFLKYYDNVLNVWKKNVTGYFPAFHTRNFFGGTFNNWLAGVKNPNRYLQAHDIVRGKAGFITTKLGEKISYDDVRRMINELGVTGMPGMIDVMKQTEDLIGRGFIKTAADYPSFLMEIVEDRLRVPLFLDRIIRGEAPQNAAKAVVKYHFDYAPEAFSAFERGVMRRLVPFYTWTKNNIPLQFSELFKQPGKYAGVFKTVRAADKASGDDLEQIGRDREMLPMWMQEMLLVKLPGKDKDGKNKYVQVDLPMEDLGKLQKTEILSMLSPILKYPLERIANKNIYFDSPIVNKNLPKEFQTAKVFADLDGLPEPIKKFINFKKYKKKNYYTGEYEDRFEVDAIKLHAVRMFVGRYYSTIDQLFNEQNALEKLMRLIMGAPIRQQDPAETKFYKNVEESKRLQDIYYTLKNKQPQ